VVFTNIVQGRKTKIEMGIEPTMQETNEYLNVTK
jgi:hypothetical protein